MTRIVAGEYGGRRLRVPAKGTRPTSERVREALFSSLDAEGVVEGARVLDLYAGSGALGLEALSRGAAEVLFVEADQRAVGVLRGNIAELGAGAARVSRSKAATVLAVPPQGRFDLVFADPPYGVDDHELEAVLAALAADWLAPDALVTLERAARDGPPPWPESLPASRERRYGGTVLHAARHTPAAH